MPTTLKSVEIRPAQPSDEPAILAVDAVPLIPARVEYVRHSIAAGHCAVAVADGRIVGYAVLNYSFYGCGFLSMLMVDKPFRRCGVGTALLRRAETLCTTPKLFISTNESNRPMQGLLGRLGYQPSGKIENLDEGDPELVFIKWLQPRPERPDLRVDSTGVGSAPMMQIRCYLPTDEPAVVALWKTVFASTAPHNDPVMALRRKLAVDSDLLFVALLDDQLIGTVMGGYDGHRGWVYSLAVVPGQRGKGVGKALMDQVEQALAQRGCPKINLQVLLSNAEVVAFYRKLGYSVEERISMGKLL